MVAGDDPGLVYALNRDYNTLDFINAGSGQITDNIELPYTQPLAMSWSSIDDKLYIVSKFSGNVTVFDPADSEITQIPFSYAKDGRDIEVAPALRRIYVLSTDMSYNYLSIIDMDTESVLFETRIDADSIVVDETRELLFGSDTYMSKYSVNGDTLVLEQKVRSGSNPQKINISPDGLHIVLPCGGGNGSGYTIYDYDATDLTNFFGEWSVEARMAT